jgi:hypothetical protein
MKPTTLVGNGCFFLPAIFFEKWGSQTATSPFPSTPHPGRVQADHWPPLRVQWIALDSPHRQAQAHPVSDKERGGVERSEGVGGTAAHHRVD